MRQPRVAVAQRGRRAPPATADTAPPSCTRVTSQRPTYEDEHGAYLPIVCTGSVFLSYDLFAEPLREVVATALCRCGLARAKLFRLASDACAGAAALAAVADAAEAVPRAQEGALVPLDDVRAGGDV